MSPPTVGVQIKRELCTYSDTRDYIVKNPWY
jgi:hypothetical protein